MGRWILYNFRINCQEHIRAHLSSSPSRSTAFILPYIMGTAKTMPAAPPIPAQRGHCLPTNDEMLLLRKTAQEREGSQGNQPGKGKKE